MIPDDPETVAEWVEWEAAFNRKRRRLIREETGLTLLEKREQKRRGEWRPYPKGSDDRWSEVNADFPEDGQNGL